MTERYYSFNVIEGYAPDVPADSDNQITVATGIIHDEDLRLTVPELTGGSNAYRVWSRSGAGAWIWDTTSFPYANATYPYWNQFTGGAWGKTEMADNQFVNAWVIATSAITANHGIIVVMGQAVYSNLGDAQNETWDDLVLGTTPPWTEFAPLWRVTIGSSSGYVTTGHARIESVADGRTVLSSSTVVVNSTAQELYFDGTDSDLTLPAITGDVFACVNSNPDTITRSSGSFVTDGFIAGQKIKMSGFVNGGNSTTTFTIAQVAADKLTLILANSLAAESAGNMVTISTDRERLTRSPATGDEIDESVSAVLADGDVTVDSYLTPAGYPNANTIPAGTWLFRGWGYVSSTSGGSVTTIKWQVVKVSATGVQTVLFTTLPTVVTATTLATAQELRRFHSIPADIPLETTDRLAIRVVANTSTSQTRVLHWIYQGSSRASHVETTLTIAGVSLPPGGTTGQVLVKNSNSDFDVRWETL